MMSHLGEPLRAEVDRVSSLIVIADPSVVAQSIEQFLDTLHGIVQDQHTIYELNNPDTDENPFDEPLAFLSMAKQLIPKSMLQTATVLLFILYRSIDFGTAGQMATHEDLLARVDETLGSFGLGSVSLVELWNITEEYDDQRQKLWASVMQLLTTTGDQCRLREAP